MTQEAFAHELGVKSAAWSSWEAGRTHPSDVIALAVAIERRFGVPAAWTLGILGGVERRQGNTPAPEPRPRRRWTDMAGFGGGAQAAMAS